MKKRTSILSGLVLFFTLILTAQQTPHYTQYMYNMQTINPAYVGARADLTIGLLARSQWMGVDGAPKTNTFSLNGRLLDGVGLGLSVISDKLGLSSITNANIDASYTIPVSHYGRLALGLKGGMTFYNNNLDQGITPDNEIYAATNGNYPNVGVGAFLYTNRYFVGLSIPYLLNTPQYIYDTTVYETRISRDANAFLSAGVLLEINDKLKFKPTTLIKYAHNLPLSIDLNTNFLYDERMEFGLSYRYNDSISAVFAIFLNETFRIGYAYDHTLTDFGVKSSHEIMLLIDLNFKGRPRWLNNTSCYF